MAATYEASVPQEISTFVPQVDSEVLAAADDASAALVRFDSELASLTAPFASILLRSESASSSQIENLTADARAIAEAELGERETGNAPLIVQNVHAMEAAMAMADQLSAESIIKMQSVLLNHDKDLTGQFRADQVWIGASSISPHGASFVPPHHTRVGRLIDDLVVFMRRTDIPVLVQAAIAHAQFETIHPFPDGNGRTGRALVQAMLRRGGLTTHVTVPVSAGLLADIDAYFAALTSYRRGSVNDIVRVFAEAALVAITNGRELALDIRSVQDRWTSSLDGIRADSSARRLTTIALEHPVLNAEVAQERLGVSKPVTYAALDTLVDRGILKPANSRKRNRIWVAEPVLVALDAFASRVARRRLPT